MRYWNAYTLFLSLFLPPLPVSLDDYRLNKTKGFYNFRDIKTVLRLYHEPNCSQSSPDYKDINEHILVPEIFEEVHMLELDGEN